MAAPKGNKYAEGNEGGRPTLYKKEYAELAYNYTILGATDEILAKFFEVSIQTIHNWKHEHEEFLDSLKKGKEIADMTIASRLFERAKGVMIKRQQAFKVKSTEYSKDGKKLMDYEDIKVVDVMQEEPPDTTAIIFWLKNRAPQQWRDKVENKLSFEGQVQPIIQFSGESNEDNPES